MTRQIHVGGVPIGGGAPVTIQSMTNTRTDDVEATLAQIRSPGCGWMSDRPGGGALIMAAARAVGQDQGGQSASQWWWTSTSTTSWPWRPSRPERTRCASTRAISAERTGSRRWQTPAVSGASPSASVSTAALWRSRLLAKYGGVMSGGHGGVSLRPHPSAEQIRF